MRLGTQRPELAPSEKSNQPTLRLDQGQAVAGALGPFD